MYIKLNYFYFSDFDLEVKMTEILKYILSEETWSGVWEKLPSFRKILVTKIDLFCPIEK